jgi:hypothetical protein
VWPQPSAQSSGQEYRIHSFVSLILKASKHASILNKVFVAICVATHTPPAATKAQIAATKPPPFGTSAQTVPESHLTSGTE